MRIVVNGEDIGRFDLDLDIKFPKENHLLDDVHVHQDGWGESTIDGRPVRWWVGFTEKPLREKELQGISVLARGKLVQRPFFFQQTAGAEGQLGQEYSVGEVQADWLDEGHDIEDDLIQANRDQLQLADVKDTYLLRAEDYRGQGTFSADLFSALQECADLYQHGLLNFGGEVVFGLTDIKPASMQLQGVGGVLHRLMRLHEIPQQDISPIAHRLGPD